MSHVKGNHNRQAFILSSTQGLLHVFLSFLNYFMTLSLVYNFNCSNSVCQLCKSWHLQSADTSLSKLQLKDRNSRLKMNRYVAAHKSYAHTLYTSAFVLLFLRLYTNSVSISVVHNAFLYSCEKEHLQWVAAPDSKCRVLSHLLLPKTFCLYSQPEDNPALPCICALLTYKATVST